MTIPPIDSRTVRRPIAAASTPDDRSSFRETLETTVSRIADGDRALAAIVDRGASGAPIDSGELLRLQASVYRTTQELDLLGRLVDKAAQAVKTTLQSQS